MMNPSSWSSQTWGPGHSWFPGLWLHPCSVQAASRGPGLLLPPDGCTPSFPPHRQAGRAVTLGVHPAPSPTPTVLVIALPLLWCQTGSDRSRGPRACLLSRKDQHPVDPREVHPRREPRMPSLVSVAILPSRFICIQITLLHSTPESFGYI